MQRIRNELRPRARAKCFAELWPVFVEPAVASAVAKEPGSIFFLLLAHKMKEGGN
jgi:hypothetical protein